MRLILPISVSDALLTSSNVLESDYPEWASNAVYGLGARVILATSHQVFESLVAGNVGHNPFTDTSDPPKWLLLGSTNRWRMFDRKIGSKTSRADMIDVTLTPGSVFNAVALFALSAGTVTLTMTNGEAVVYSRSVELVSTIGESSYYAYCFDPIERRADVAVWDLPAYPGATLRVQISQPDGTAECGLLIVGRGKRVCAAKWGVKFSIDDYSTELEDGFGGVDVIEGAYSKITTLTAQIETSRISALHSQLAALRSQPVVWDVVDGVEAGLIYGRYKNFSIVMSYPTVSYCDFDIKGLI